MAAVMKSPNKDPTEMFLYSVVGYVALLFLVGLTGSGLLKAVSNAAAFGIFLFMALISFNLPHQKNVFFGFAIAIALYYYGMFVSLAFNIRTLDWPDALKMLIAPAFLAFGMSFEAQRRSWLWTQGNTPLLFLSLILIPLCLWLWQLATGLSSFGSALNASIFANRNNAALYAVTLIAFYTVLTGKPVKHLLIYLLVGTAFGTLGVLVAITLSLTILVARPRMLLYAIPAAIALGGLYFFAPGLDLFSRLTVVIDSYRLIAGGNINLTTVSFADLVRQLHTSDLSFIFRLKHWLDLLDIYGSGSVFDWVFGFGVGASATMARIHLVPHNDYLRILFECGLLTFTGFVLIIGLIIYHCGRRWETVALLTVAIYFMSENLVNNFTAMIMFYFCGGALAFRIRTAHENIKN